MIDAYAKYVGWIAIEEDNWETFAWEALIIRSELAEQWAMLSTAEAQRVERADERLAGCVGQLQDILPGAGDYPRSHWWWHLYEGPEVREQMLQAA
jgi:hypothetical protein